jgi:subtilisin family serine protease
MSEQKEYIVVVKPNEDLAILDSEMSASTGSGVVPNRAVECCDACEHDTRMTHWMLTDEEAKELEKDERVLGVDLPYDNDPTVERVRCARQSGTFNKTTTNDGVNWGLSRCSSQVNNFDDVTSLFDNYKYAMTGEGVDVVIFDSGIELDHPEFKDAAGNARIQTIDWYSDHGGPGNPHSGGSLGGAFYTDSDGHATHVAGISCGKTYGWAKNAHIYVMKIFDTDAIGDQVGMDLIKYWHENKGTGRPTVVNMSYGYYHVIDGWNGAAAGDSGQHWDTFTNQMDVWTFGDTNFTTKSEVNQQVDVSYVYRLSTRLASVDAKLDQLIAAGIHVTIAGGNSADVQYNYSDDANDNYNDFFSRPSHAGGAPVYYHRGSSPRASTVKSSEMVVTNIGVEIENSKEVLSSNSACGEAMDINAPGTNITSAFCTSGAGTSDYPPDPNFKIKSISGTSMAAPQVAGVMALYLQNEPNLTPTELKAKILHDAKTGLLYDTVWDQKDLGKYRYIENSINSFFRPDRGLFGAPNRVLYNRFVGDVFVQYVTSGGD